MSLIVAAVEVTATPFNDKVPPFAMLTSPSKVLFPSYTLLPTYVLSLFKISPDVPPDEDPSTTRFVTRSVPLTSKT